MALPSGYTRLDYIESSGTQYIDTGFKPNGNTQVDIKFKMVNQGTAQQSIFGARPGSSGRFTVFTGTNSAALQVDYGTESSLSSPDTAISGLSLNTMTELSMSNALVVNGTTVKTVSAVTFTSTYNLYLFANNNAGVVQLPSAMLLYSCKIYDNGTLVRDFIPCKNASGAIGLWDNVNSVFYANAGTGTFSTGKKHKVLINGTGYETKSGRVLIAGTGYDIKKGRTLIGGTGYDIKFTTPIGELPVGTSVYMNVDGVRTEFIVGHQGNLTLVYSNSEFSSGTWLLMKDIYALDTFYNLETVFNKFFSKLDVTIQALAKPISHYNGIGSKVTGKVATPTIGSIEGNSSYKYVKMDYFTTKSQNIAFFNGEATSWWLDETLRYSSSLGENEASMIMYDGSRVGTRASYTEGFRPLLVLSPDAAKIDDNFNIIPT